MAALLSAINGALFLFSLIVAIGPQNTFVLRQGLARRHVTAVVVVCVISDVLLIAVGAAGLGAALGTRPVLIEVVRFAGAGFLASYAIIALRRSWRAEQLVGIDVAVDGTLLRSVSTCLAFTWLNPHVYLDTVVLMGAVASAQGPNILPFTLGAMIASLTWFVGLGFGARFLRPLFSRPNAVRILDVSIAVVMLTIGLTLLRQGLNS